jgi:hypothetical protein
MLVVEQYILDGNIQQVLSIKVNLTNLNKETNQITRELTSLALDSDEN